MSPNIIPVLAKIFFISCNVKAGSASPSGEANPATVLCIDFGTLHLSYGHQSAADLCFLRKLFTSSPAGFLTRRSSPDPPSRTGLCNGCGVSLPAYSDRIVQDFHLIPYYLIDASMGTEKLFLEYNSVL